VVPISSRFLSKRHVLKGRRRRCEPPLLREKGSPVPAGPPIFDDADKIIPKCCTALFMAGSGGSCALSMLLQVPACNPQPSTLSPRPSTLDPKPGTRNPEPEAPQPKPSQPPADTPLPVHGVHPGASSFQHCTEITIGGDRHTISSFVLCLWGLTNVESTGSFPLQN